MFVIELKHCFSTMKLEIMHCLYGEDVVDALLKLHGRNFSLMEYLKVYILLAKWMKRSIVYWIELIHCLYTGWSGSLTYIENKMN